METGQQSENAVGTLVSPSPAPATGAGAPVFNLNKASDSTPPHTQTQSTLAPTSEYVRYLLLALPARYVPRGIVGALFETNHFDRDRLGLGKNIKKIATWVQKKFHIDANNFAHKNRAEQTAALAYNSIMGIGSLALTASYSRAVYKDIRNIFSEAVGEELGKPASEVGLSDLQRSDNRIVQKTMNNFWWRSFKRGFTDLLFFPAAAARNPHLGDLMVGGKALQAFTETWERKPTMFEDLVTFVNNKINPRNGLGQAISVGEVFDLYQHYTEAFNPEHMFTNVLERGTGEGARWAQSQPIFERITELMNLTYAYKHSSVIDPTTGHAIHQADLTLPKVIYLLGHDLIDVRQPAQTLVTIEVANRFGIPAIKEMQTMLKSGASLAQVSERFPPSTVHLTKKKDETPEKNGVIAKGSTRQLDMAEDAPQPTNTVATDSIVGRETLAINDPASALAANART